MINIKNTIIEKIIPSLKPGNHYDIRGRKGNKLLKQIKNEDGKIFVRDKLGEDWEIFIEQDVRSD